LKRLAIEVGDLSDTENPNEAVESAEPSLEQPAEVRKPPEARATGNDLIAVLKHNLPLIIEEDSRTSPNAVELAIRNVSGTTIATAVFEAVFYDGEGNVVYRAKHREVDLVPETSRAVLIDSAIPERGLVQSYDVKLIRTTTADVEKVQLRRHEVIPIETGETEVRGIAKNISKVKTDAAVVVVFYDANNENIGTKVKVLRDIEPESTRQYDFKVRLQDGDLINNYRLVIGEVVV
jgi:hypothetical protein